MGRLDWIRQPICQIAFIISFISLWLLWLGIQWLSSLPFIAQVILGAATGLTSMTSYSYTQTHRFHGRRIGIVNLAQLSSADVVALRRLLPDHEKALSWLPGPSDVETGRWINVALDKAWPYIKEACSGIIKAQLETVLNKYTSEAVQDFSIEKIDLGNSCPYVEGIKFINDSKDKISLEIEIDWRNNQEQEMVLHLLTSGPEYSVQVKHFMIYAAIKITFTPLKEKLPCYGALVLTIMESPLVDFKTKITGDDVQKIPELQKAVDSILLAALMDVLVWPNRVVVPFIPGDYSELKASCVGHLHVKLVEAKELANKDIAGKSDPYVVLSVGWGHDLMKESSVAWNEELLFDVEDAAAQKLTVKVMNLDHNGVKLCVGTAEVPINQVEENTQKSIWIDLIGDPIKLGSRTAGKVNLLMEFKPFKPAHRAYTSHERTYDATLLPATKNGALKGLASILTGNKDVCSLPASSSVSTNEARKRLTTALEGSKDASSFPISSTVLTMNRSNDVKGLGTVLEGRNESIVNHVSTPSYNILHTGSVSTFDECVPHRTSNGVYDINLHLSELDGNCRIIDNSNEIRDTMPSSDGSRRCLESADMEVMDDILEEPKLFCTHGKAEPRDEKACVDYTANKEVSSDKMEVIANKLEVPKSISTDTQVELYGERNTNIYSLEDPANRYGDINKSMPAVDVSNFSEEKSCCSIIHDDMFESEIFQVD